MITSPKNYKKNSWSNKKFFATSTRGLSFWVVNSSTILEHSQKKKKKSTILERCQGVGEIPWYIGHMQVWDPLPMREGG